MWAGHLGTAANRESAECNQVDCEESGVVGADIFPYSLPAALARRLTITTPNLHLLPWMGGLIRQGGLERASRATAAATVPLSGSSTPPSLSLPSPPPFPILSSHLPFFSVASKKLFYNQSFLLMSVVVLIIN